MVTMFIEQSDSHLLAKCWIFYLVIFHSELQLLLVHDRQHTASSELSVIEHKSCIFVASDDSRTFVTVSSPF